MQMNNSPSKFDVFEDKWLFGLSRTVLLLLSILTIVGIVGATIVCLYSLTPVGKAKATVPTEITISLADLQGNNTPAKAATNSDAKKEAATDPAKAEYLTVLYSFKQLMPKLNFEATVKKTYYYGYQVGEEKSPGLRDFIEAFLHDRAKFDPADFKGKTAELKKLKAVLAQAEEANRPALYDKYVEKYTELKAKVDKDQSRIEEKYQADTAKKSLLRITAFSVLGGSILLTVLLTLLLAVLSIKYQVMGLNKNKI
jgi:hypothetical protein